MAIQFHPEQGTILICDFHGLVAPEMIKRRPVVVVSPRLRRRSGLCTVVPLSTTPPTDVAPYHYKLHMETPLPKPYDSPHHWVKADMIYAVGFSRLYLPFAGKDVASRRTHDVRVIDKADLLKIQEAMLHGLGLTTLTGYL